MLKLVLQVTHPKTKEITSQVFDRLPILIGRSRICDLCLDDNLASRQHCILELDEKGALRLVDLESANGTRVNDEKISKLKAEVGLEFVVGESLIAIEKITKVQDDSTVHDLTPVDLREVPEVSATKFVEDAPKNELTKPRPKEPEVKQKLEPSAVSSAQAEEILKPRQDLPPETPPEIKESSELTLKTPTVFRAAKKSRPVGQTKDWVQVSVFWKNELIDIKCFDRGSTVKVGRSPHNDFLLESPALPEELPLLKIIQTGVELNLHPSFKGIVETRGKAQNLDELRKIARQTELGFCVFIPFQDRCLVELGDFSIFIQAVRLQLTGSLETPLVKEPLFSGILGGVFSFFLLFLIIISNMGAIQQPEEEKEDQLVVKLEPPNETPPPIERRQIQPEPKKPVQKKQGVAPSTKAQLSGKEGEGARAKGKEGKRGSAQGKVATKSRSVGFETKKSPPVRAKPKGSFGDVAQRNQAKRGLRKDQGVGTGRPNPKAKTSQAASPKPKPQVKVEDEGLLGVMGGSGGGGTAGSGGQLAGSGLGGELEGAVAGLERGSQLDGRGSGGRGTKGKYFGGGGEAVDVGGLGTKGKGGGRSGFGLGSSGTKGEAEVSYVAEEVEVRDGLTREEIERVVRAHQSEIRACYEKSMIRASNTNLSGRLKVSWFVNSAGRATSVKKLSGFGEEAGLYECVASRIQSWQFPRPRGGSGAQVSWPFVFTNGR